MRSSRSSLLAAAALAAGLGVIGAAPPGAASHAEEARSTGTQAAAGSKAGAKAANQLRQAERDTQAWSIFGRSGWRTPRYPRPGWSVRQGQRMAKKRRNQKRHRAACR